MHELVPRSDTAGLTGGSNATIDFKGTSCSYLHCEETAMITQIKDDPIEKSNPHNGFPLAPFKDFGSR